jgi:uncharacterized peroxidase-related enzyme
MAWIAWVDEAEAESPVAETYERARRGFGFVPDVVKIFSLRPQVAAAQDLLRQALLGPASSLGARRADMVSAMVAGLNRCRYCSIAHAGMLTERGDLAQADALTLLADWRALDLPEDERAMLAFAEKLTNDPEALAAGDVQGLRDRGFSDENVYDIVLLTAYRNYLTRVIAGLGVSVDRLRQRFGDEYVDTVLAVRL